VSIFRKVGSKPAVIIGIAALCAIELLHSGYTQNVGRECYSRSSVLASPSCGEPVSSEKAGRGGMV
jgi:hypothetical protein